MTLVPIINHDGSLVRAEVDGVQGYVFQNTESGDSMPCSDDSGPVLEYFKLAGVVETSVSVQEDPATLATTSESDPQHCQILTSSAQAKDGGVAHWIDESAVKHLIALWHKHERDFQSTTIRNEVVWKKIAAELQATNTKWNYTGLQCENKFKYQRKEYNKTKDHNRQTGNAPKMCKFFEEFDEIFCDKPCVKPVTIASSCTKRPFPEAENYVGEGDGQCEPDTHPCSLQLEKQVSKKKTRVQRELQEWADTFRLDAQKREEARQKRHEEGLAVYKDVMGKLIEKLG